MKLYCCKFKKDNNIVDVQHILANDNKEVYKRLDNFLLDIAKYDGNYANSYSFFEVCKVDNFDLSVLLDKYLIENNKIINRIQ